jgi:hypothetical protein
MNSNVNVFREQFCSFYIYCLTSWKLRMNLECCPVFTEIMYTTSTRTRFLVVLVLGDYQSSFCILLF